MDRSLSGRRLIEEFDHQGQIDTEPQHVVRVNLAIGAKPGDASEDSHAFHGMPVGKAERICCNKVLRRPWSASLR